MFGLVLSVDIYVLWDCLRIVDKLFLDCFWIVVGLVSGLFWDWFRIGFGLVLERFWIDFVFEFLFFVFCGCVCSVCCFCVLISCLWLCSFVWTVCFNIAAVFQSSSGCSRLSCIQSVF